MNQGQRIVVVGSCASGKSTLVAALRAYGFEAYACAQEHSGIKTLWRHYNPDLVVLLETDLRTIRSRRSPTWPSNLYRVQRRRLASARSAANVIINTATTDIPTSVELVVDELAGRTKRDERA